MAVRRGLAEDLAGGGTLGRDTWEGHGGGTRGRGTRGHGGPSWLSGGSS